MSEEEDGQDGQMWAVGVVVMAWWERDCRKERMGKEGYTSINGDSPETIVCIIVEQAGGGRREQGVASTYLPDGN